MTTRLGYEPIVPGDSSGWTLRQATTSTVQMNDTPSSDDLTTTTRYDTAGRVIAQSLPGSTGTDARTRVTSYYTATGTGTCVNPANAGLPCRVGPAAQPAAGNPLPTTSYSYNQLGQPLTATETSGSTTRTTTSSYDTAGRVTGTAIATTGLTGSTPVPASTITYATSTGLPTTTTSGGQTLTTGYDTLGQVVSYTDATGNTATTSYDTSGRITSANDGKATTTYTYDTSSEHRGLVTTQDPGTPGGGLFTVAYDADGRPRGTTYPNGTVRNQRYDNTGQPAYLDWGAASDYAFTQTYDTAGRTAHSHSTAGGDQRYGYDNAGRLTQVADTQPGAGGSTAACTTRRYTFSKTSNRTQLAAYPDAAGGTSSTGSCSTNTTPASTTGTFDDADRITTTGYSYDNLGRTLTIPATDAVGSGASTGVTGNLTVGYYDNDMAATLDQGGHTRSYTLDPNQDRILAVDDGTTQHLNTYTDPSDSPSWTTTQPLAAPARIPTNTSWERHLAGPDGALAGTQTSDGTTTWNITDSQGNIIATTPAGGTTPTAGTTWTEYGTPRDPARAGTYGWLGTHQRSTDTLAGLTLMGVRLYNPTTGRFLTVDPIYGGNTNPYVYPTDPINNSDLDGHRSRRSNPVQPCYCAGIGWGWISRSRVKSVWDLFRSPSYAEHKKNARPSTGDKHDKSKARAKQAKGGEKGDARRRGNPNKKNGRLGGLGYA
ncbi:RHS repeat-associated core domain-containing protein [Nakamurella lactea]|uniref:RHS repeat-associated core domain-containing protein n=1 Tax=Nakamurella lactea TaxID=459515 RepID=UPI00040CDB19|nr:RHS repeat-associated core domain-containing protein [Nakamurella lactea]